MNRVLLLVCLIIGVGFIIFAVNAVNDASNTPEAGRPVQGDAGELLDWAKSQSWGKKESVSVNGGTLVIEITGYNTLYDLTALAGGPGGTGNGKALSYIYYKSEPGTRSTA